MAVNRAAIVDQNFRELIAAHPAPPVRRDPEGPARDGGRLSGRLAIEIFESMVASRQLDLEARILKNRNEGFYTIGSSGHEGNAAVAAAARPTDMAFLHYRSGGFFVQRARQVPGTTPLLDVLLGLVAAKDEPIAGGRHKVFGSVPLKIPPQTSTIASHLPKAVGAAFSIARRRRLQLPMDGPDDQIVLCSFGDASSNHASACTAFNAASLADHQHLPCPLLFVCEDNGIGISVRTPGGWVGRRFRADTGIRYFHADGLDLISAYEVALEAVDFVRSQRRPAILHLEVVRLMGHAGSDVEQSYRSEEEILKIEARDPLLCSARALIEAGLLDPTEILAIYEEARVRISALGLEAQARARLKSAQAVIAPLAPLQPEALAIEAARPVEPEARLRFHGRLPEEDRPRHMAMLLNRALGDLLLKYPELLLFGEDVARKGGVYHVTADLQKRASVGRVFNTPLDETTILGLAIGAGHMGFLPMPEIQYLAYLHNAIDQLRGEAASLQFFSNGQYRNPMVVRIAGLAYQKGFGGHFHNDNSIAALREIPGILIAVPSNARDAVGLLRTCTAAAHVDGAVAIFLEPIALYMTRDLHTEKDEAWSFAYPPPEEHIPVGVARSWSLEDHLPEGVALPPGPDALTILTYGNGTWMSLRVAGRLAREGHRIRVVDLRWLKPLPREDALAAARATGRVLVVDECRAQGGVADALVAMVALEVPGTRLGRVEAMDSYIPLGDAANLVLVQEADIEAAARDLLEQP